ncbi:hypothetical protein ACLOJK_024000 [Asimina triloba]
MADLRNQRMHLHPIFQGRPSQADAQTAPHRSIQSLPISKNIVLFKQHLDDIKGQRPIIRWPPPAPSDRRSEQPNLSSVFKPSKQM